MPNIFEQSWRNTWQIRGKITNRLNKQGQIRRSFLSFCTKFNTVRGGWRNRGKVVLRFKNKGVNSQSKKKTGAKSQFRYKARVKMQEPLYFMTERVHSSTSHLYSVMLITYLIFPLSVVKMAEVEQSSCCIFWGSLIHMYRHLWNTKEEEDVLLYRRCS